MRSIEGWPFGCNPVHRRLFFLGRSMSTTLEGLGRHGSETSPPRAAASTTSGKGTERKKQGDERRE